MEGRGEEGGGRSWVVSEDQGGGGGMGREDKECIRGWWRGRKWGRNIVGVQWVDG